MDKHDFFRQQAEGGWALSFDDVRLGTSHSEVDPVLADISSRFSRRVDLKCPIVSAPMDTVTELEMAIGMPKKGGLGVIHRGLSDAEQLIQARMVKTHLNAVIERPVSILSTYTLEEVVNKIQGEKLSFKSFPVVNSEGVLEGVITEDTFIFSQGGGVLVGEVMQKVFAPVNTSISEAEIIMRKERIKALPLVDHDGKCVGMYTLSDVNRITRDKHDKYNVDKDGHLRVGVAIGVGDVAAHATNLVSVGVDVLVIDTAHGDSLRVINTLKLLKREFDHSDVDIVVGNISEGESAKCLVDAGADGIKVGQGPGSICITQKVSGTGCSQVTAVYNCVTAIEGSGIPVIADGGISFSGDITIAIATGADCVMLGKMLAGTDESPGEIVTKNGIRYKPYRGMGSPGAMRHSQQAAQRYGETGKNHLVPEGVEGSVPYQGSVSDVIDQCNGGLQKGMGYIGAPNIQSLQEKAKFYRISVAGLKESGPHGLSSYQSTSNYFAEGGS
jgi:IMP dehydrogenase